MDKNTITGLALIGVIFFGFFWMNQPNEEQQKAQKRYQDSVSAVMEKTAKAQADAELEAKKAAQLFDENDSDSLKAAKLNSTYGVFAGAAIGKEEMVVLKNCNVNVEISTKGGYVKRVVLNQYKTYDGNPLVLFSGDESSLDLSLPVMGGNELNTADLYFKVSSLTDSSVVLSLPAGNGSSLNFVYTLPSESYMLDFDIKPINLGGVLKPAKDLNLLWKTKLKQQEKGRKFENRYAAIYYKLMGDGVEELSESSSESESVSQNMKWVAFKDQFFSSVLIADKSIKSADLTSEMAPENSSYLKYYTAEMVIPFNTQSNDEVSFRYFYGPNWYKLLKSYDKNLTGDNELELKRLVPLGWGIFRWVNQILTIPLFNFFGSFICNFGIIILLLTIVVKMILFPLTYKSYLSSAKMRVLKPEVQKINESISDDKPTERQQAMMDMYRKAGVNPMGGCLPMLLQMPILVALFYFFPTAIELRQQSFLWASDLSSYDAIVSWTADIPIISSTFGNHISLFCLLMTITNVIYTKVNMSMTDTGSQQMPGMKYIMYFMPLMFLFIFNDYASGLSYYYFVSLLITIAQTFIIRRFVDEDKLLKQIHENRKKPQKKSAWMQRLEDLQDQAKKQQNERNVR
ncbi:MAG: membrane protein insertase YidC [Paludibacteraceae bacterium]|nr:membrane protein insertase YidC [Prevotellaceae bacterium]